MRLVSVVLFWAFAAEASAQVCSATGDSTIIADPAGALDRLATLTGTIVVVDEGPRLFTGSADDLPPCGPCVIGGDVMIGGTYRSYLFQYYAAIDGSADATFELATSALAVILDRDRLSATDDAGIVPGLLRSLADRSIEGDDVVTVNGSTVTLHFEASILMGLDHVRVLAAPDGSCSPMTDDAGVLDAGSIPGTDGAVIASDAAAILEDASNARRDGGSIARRDSGSTPGDRSAFQFEGGGGCACRASGGSATAAPLVVLALVVLGARSRRRDSR